MKATSHTALIDGDIIAYRCCTAGEQKFDWGDTGGKTIVYVSEKKAIEAALRMTEAWKAAAGCKTLIVGFTPTGVQTFRHIIWPGYKPGRPPKPPIHAAVVEAMMREFPHHNIPGLEADDVLGILATTDRMTDKSVVITMDKDLQTIPGRHFRPGYPGSSVFLISPGHADYAWMTQTLTGDAVDGFKGLPKVGPQKAGVILGSSSIPPTLSRMWPKVVEAYRRAGKSENEALLQARLARILRRQDYDQSTKEVLLWHPLSPVRLMMTTMFPTNNALIQPPTPSTQSA